MQTHTKERVTVRPTHDNVVVLEQTEKTSNGGIIIPDTVEGPTRYGTIVAVGPGGRNDQGQRITLDLNEGDTVVYPPYAGVRITINGSNYLVIKEHDIIATIEGERN